MRPGPLTLISALLAIAALAAATEPAAAGGTGVVAPPELTPAACEQGIHPRILGYRREVAPKVLGCAALSDGDEVLVAADSDGRHACFYVALAGGRNVDGPCVGVDGGDAPGSPPTAAPGLESLSAMKPSGGSGAYVHGLASREIPHAFLRYRTEAGAIEEWPAILIRVRERLALQLGAERPFAYFVVEIPMDAETCRRPVRVEGRGGAAELVSADRLDGGEVFVNGVALPGSEECAAYRPTAAASDELAALGAGLGAAKQA